MSSKPSIYDIIELQSVDGRTADIRAGCASIDYYEDLFSPNISVKIGFINAGGSIRDSSGQKVAIYEGLKIRGGEACKFKILANSRTNQDIDFTRKPLYVRGIKNLIRQTNRELFTLSLVSKAAVKNEVTFLQKAYTKDAPISNHVNTILKESFPDSQINKVDGTSNKYGFIGNQMKPFEALIRLASKSVTEVSNNSSAGFFFYETAEGFNFRAIDSLIQQDVKAIYIYSEVVETGESYIPTPDLPSLDFKISNFQVLKNQDVVTQLQNGAYATSKRFFNPINYDVSNNQDKFDANQYIGGVKNLGNRFDTNTLALSDKSIQFAFESSEIVSEVRDFGTVEKTVTKKPTKDIDDYVTQRKMRYNTLFTQIVYIQVPLNTNLHAGDIIECRFPKITDATRDEVDTGQISGIYMIKELNHHFDYLGSYTSMTILRDTFGLYKTNR